MPCVYSLTRTPFQLLLSHWNSGTLQTIVLWVCAMVSHRFNEHPLSWLMKLSIQIWLVGTVVTDGIITISMLYFVSLRHLR